MNPTVVGGGSWLVTNGGSSNYNALQVELRRRMAKGVLVQGSYAWSKSLSNMFASDSAGVSTPSTYRNSRNDRGPSPWDIRHGLKLNYVDELPIGPGRSFLSGGNAVVRKALEAGRSAASRACSRARPTVSPAAPPSIRTTTASSSTT